MTLKPENKEAFELYQELLVLKKNIGLHYIELGRVLLELRSGKWKDLDPEASWEAFCAYPEISLSPSHVRNLIRVYKRFVVELGVNINDLAGIDQRKLVALVPSVDKSSVEMKLLEAKTLSRSDFIETLHDVGDHEHDDEVISFKRCKICYRKEDYSKSIDS